jgi:hypothetical protein
VEVAGRVERQATRCDNMHLYRFVLYFVSCDTTIFYSILAYLIGCIPSASCCGFGQAWCASPCPSRFSVVLTLFYYHYYYYFYHDYHYYFFCYNYLLSLLLLLFCYFYQQLKNAAVFRPLLLASAAIWLETTQRANSGFIKKN